MWLLRNLKTLTQARIKAEKDYQNYHFVRPFYCLNSNASMMCTHYQHMIRRTGSHYYALEAKAAKWVFITKNMVAHWNTTMLVPKLVHLFLSAHSIIAQPG